jgi:nucleotide-binding universal stress UspA family protein
MSAMPDEVENPIGGRRSTTIIVGHNRHASSARALTVAADLTLRLGAHLHVIHAIRISDYPIDIDSPDWEERGQRTLSEQRDHVATTLDRIGVAWSYHTCRGDPANALAAAAEKHDALLIIVGTRGEGLPLALSRLIEPSVSHGVIQRQTRPVLVVP